MKTYGGTKHRNNRELADFHVISKYYVIFNGRQEVNYVNKKLNIAFV
jgi:hypothetical protein